MRFKTWLSENKIFVVALLSVIIAFSGFTLQNIVSYISPLFFPGPPDYEIVSFDIPQTFDLNLPLSVSPEYYVVMHLDFRSQVISPNDELILSISFKNKGKTDVEQPRLMLYFVDSLQQVRATWNQSLTAKEFTERLVLEYSLPPPDQKVMGSWNLIALLHDDGNRELISYVVQEFRVETARVAGPTVAIGLSLIAAIVSIGAVVMLLRRMRISSK